MTVQLTTEDKLRAGEVALAALREAGYAVSSIGYNRVDIEHVPPIMTYRAWSLGMQSVGRSVPTWDEWPQYIRHEYADDPDELRRWTNYFNRHGLEL
jgi:hypothetical protein